MPLCTNCAHPADHVYTTYATKSNVRLGVCPRCEAFLDPLIEHPPLLILLDLVLLKPRVYLHLLFNRGSSPLNAESSLVNNTPPNPTSTRSVKSNTTSIKNRKNLIYTDLFKLGTATIVAESLVRLLPLLTDGQLCSTKVVHTLLVVVVEYVSQHITTMVLAMVALWARGWYPVKKRSDTRDGRQDNFSPALIPLTLFYAALFPLLLQLFLSIWYTPPPSIHESLPTMTSSPLPFSSPLTALLPPSLLELIPLSTLSAARKVESALISAWAATDRVWAGTRLLTGMSSGFGLRVLLPTRPAETTCIVLIGWLVAAVCGKCMETILVRFYH